MPIYEYKCENCGHITEVWQKISDPSLSACEACGGIVKKIMSLNSFHLKGSGWYVTDYASRSSGSSTAKKSKDNTKNTEKTDKAEKSKVDDSSKGQT